MEFCRLAALALLLCASMNSCYVMHDAEGTTTPTVKVPGKITLP